MGARNDVSVDRLATLRLFDCCTRDELEEIRGISRAVAVEAGRDVCRQGEYEREFFVVNAGQFAVERDDELIAKLGAGEWFGEIALNSGCMRTATVTSITRSSLLVFNTRGYWSLRAICPDVADDIDAAMQDRIDVLHARFDASLPDRRPQGWRPRA